MISLWLRPAFSSLWLDELGTWWVVRGGLGDAIERAMTYHGQSPAYYLIAWLVARAGRHEFLLRLPSLLAAAGAAALLFRLVGRLVDRESARLAVLVFVASPNVAFAASDARPYALALLTLLAAATFLIRWLEEGSGKLGVAWAVAVAATVWVHYIFTPALAAFVLIAALRVRSGSTTVRWRDLILALGGIIVALLPLVAQTLSLWSRRGFLSVPSDLSLPDQLALIVTPAVAGAILIGIGLGASSDTVTLKTVPAQPFTMPFLFAWVLLPLGVLIGVSFLPTTTLFSPRYFVPAIPAAAALAGWGIRCVGPAGVRRLIALVLAIFAVASYGAPMKAHEDWRGAMSFASSLTRQDDLVLLHPALVESSQLEWLTDEERTSYLMSPVSFYGLDARIIPMPYALDEPSERYLESVIAGSLSEADGFLLITRYPHVPFRAWLDGRLAEHGFTSEITRKFGTIQVIGFTREGELAS